ncbi:MAG: DNA mismatch repair endonuclease MutL [Prevotella sp.]|nr:DNA mismatch repair endonuclease MutL [Prevotella sp.]
MSDIIQLLPDSVANQIAAGEVIQRPSSVIKELMENAVDAEATAINVAVIDAGRTLIQVIDNGKGMSETDARLAFERHATSKISKAEDLFELHTMGFRGEALASIAAVAQIELFSRQPDSELGTHLYISGSRLTEQEICSCPVGSNFKVENLFYNVPARRKFLKSNATELNNIIIAFQRIALVYPEIVFTLHSNGGELLNLRAGGLRQRIVDVFGKKLNQDLLPINVDTTICSIKGFVGKPESAKKKGAHQYFFVNGRYMKHPYFHKAVMTAFERLVPVGEQVPYFIYLEVPPQDIDVNIHPIKTEIKFSNEQSIWQILLAVVKEAIGLFNDVPAIDFDQQGKPDIPAFDPSRRDAPVPHVQYNPQYNPFKDSMPRQYKRNDSSLEHWTDLYEGLRPESEVTQETGLFDASSFDELSSSKGGMIVDRSPVHYQYKGKYIMTAVKSGLLIVDQHRAHVRILYEQYMKRKTAGNAISQKVLFPEVVHLPVSEAVVLKKMLPEMESIGFELTDLGRGDYAVNGIPDGLEGLSVANLVQDIVNSTLEQGAFSVEEIHHSMALSLARNAAQPYGQIMNNDEMENLINSLFACSNVNHTPDGKSILNILPQEEIEHLLS